VIVLDEGHAIVNHRSKVAQSAYRLRGRHRLLLSGTPIQNHSSDLWSLFEFLMPGYLGKYSSFKSKYNTSKHGIDPEEVIRLEELHRSVLPFILRREKRDVLNELPPKVIIDVPCPLSALQIQIMNDIASHNSEESSTTSRSDGVMKLRRLALTCTHPILSLTNELDHSTSAQYAHWLKDQNVSGKLSALMDILHQCGLKKSKDDCVNDDEEEEEEDDEKDNVNHGDEIESNNELTNRNHSKFIIFAQNRTTINLLRSYMFESIYQNAVILYIDGSVPSTSRIQIAKRFNSDSSVHGIVVSTRVGGLGLNLSKAENVIFIEHDWNPMVDLQAMDRAHRIGQKKTLTVYRLYCENSIEEKILNIQKKKLTIAKTIVNHENTTLSVMGTDRMMDLISTNTTTNRTLKETAKEDVDHRIEDQYNDFDIENFMDRFENA